EFVLDFNRVCHLFFWWRWGSESSFYVVRYEQSEMCLNVRLAFFSLQVTVKCMSSSGFCTLTVQFSTKIAKRQKLWFWHFPRYCLYTSCWQLALFQLVQF